MMKYEKWKHKNSNGIFVFICTSHDLKQESFPHMVVILMTLETPKNIFCGNNLALCRMATLNNTTLSKNITNNPLKLFTPN